MVAAIGLDIGSSAVRAVQLARSRAGLTLERLGQVVLDPDAVIDGIIEDPAAVVESIQILIERFDFKGRKVALGMANQQVIVRRVELPMLPEEGFADAIRERAADHLPVPMTDVEFDYELVEVFTTEDGTEMMRVLLVAADREIVARTLDCVRAAKLKPVQLDLDAFAQIRSLRHPNPPASQFGPYEDEGGELIVNIGAELSTICVHSAGVPRFVRTITLGGDDITESLASAFGLPWEQAETVKSVAPGSASPYAGLLIERIAMLVEEIRNSADYYRSEPGAVHLDHAILTGGSSLIPDLDRRLEAALRLDVHHGRPFRSVSVGDLPIDADDLESAQPFFAVAMGLALVVTT